MQNSVPQPNQNLRFGVTYEGLKPLLSSRESRRCRCFGVTYEGLKPAAGELPIFSEKPVLELPMRV